MRNKESRNKKSVGWFIDLYVVSTVKSIQRWNSTVFVTTSHHSDNDPRFFPSLLLFPISGELHFENELRSVCVQRRKFFGKLRFFARRKKIPRNRTNDSWNFLGWKEKKKKKRRGGREGRRRRRGRGGWNVGRFFSWSKAPVSISTFQSLSNRSPPLRVLGIAARKVERNIISRINFSQVSGRIEGSVATGGEKVNSRVRHENPSFQSLQTLVKRITIFNLTVRPGTGDKRSFRVEDSS